MKIALGALAVLFVMAPIHAQGWGGGLTPPSNFPTLPWTPPTNFLSVDVSGAEATFAPSTFMTFSGAIAEGNIALKQDSKSIAQVAAESRRTKLQSKIMIEQDENGNVVMWKKN
jgi:hypothetical protein